MTQSKQVSARGLLILFVMLSCLAADQFSKQWALTNLVRGQPQEFIPGLLRLTLTTNPGAAFSLGSQNGEIMGLVATLLTVLILGWVVKRVISNKPLPVVEQIGMGCLLGGACGNLLDRLNHGQVTDFLEFTFMRFPVFNVADSLIDVGIGCLFLAVFLCSKNEEPPSTSASPTEESEVAGTTKND